MTQGKAISWQWCQQQLPWGFAVRTGNRKWPPLGGLVDGRVQHAQLRVVLVDRLGIPDLETIANNRVAHAYCNAMRLFWGRQRHTIATRVHQDDCHSRSLRCCCALHTARLDAESDRISDSEPDPGTNTTADTVADPQARL